MGQSALSSTASCSAGYRTGQEGDGWRTVFPWWPAPLSLQVHCQPGCCSPSLLLLSCQGVSLILLTHNGLSLELGKSPSRGPPACFLLLSLFRTHYFLVLLARMVAFWETEDISVFGSSSHPLGSWVILMKLASFSGHAVLIRELSDTIPRSLNVSRSL